MSDTPPTVSALAGAMLVAITVTYNSGDVLRDFLDCCVRQAGDWRLIVVDNASTDNTRSILADYHDPRVTTILNTDNVGFAAGCNQGIRIAMEGGARQVLLVNNDTVFDDGVFVALSARLIASRADAVSPVIAVHPDGQSIWYAGGRIDWSRGARNLHDHFNEPVASIGPDDFSTTFCPACFMLFDIDVFRRVGLMTEDYFVYWEDVDYCERMNLAGARMLVTPSITVLHKVSATTGAMSDFTLKHLYRNRMLFARRFGSGAMAAYTFAMIFAAIGGRFLFKGDPMSKARLRVRAVMAGLRMPVTPGKVR
ncbi:glycosyltransferase family 2 protein [Sphingomonas sp. KR1UV-12]|uniref:Glycosyltransferase family 2 protein n=1 Tax=Sphingomonas aurea TaxID=3063994 RepID=A0ABT9EG67_9SPHN|nr:glycosyltransferase family 2 protein [Sphingomonas sp. KR1UV-12]MDP1025959.1 glycosyltransferase family 2 protein [Sphingomonas sp. KR1UV-12]